MTTRSANRTEDCGRAQALVRLAQADRFLEVATLVIDVPDDQSLPGVAGALAVLAGIAAADAACCAKLRMRFRGSSHRGAADLVATVSPDGSAMAKDLRRLIQKKDDAHYASEFMSRATATDMVGWAERLRDTARRVVEA